jgi:hypothetical protein
MHSFGKLVAKCLAERLSLELDRLVLPNQSVFIRGRRIHDNPPYGAAIGQSNSCKKKAPCILLKIDIARAYDSFSWPFLLEALHTWASMCGGGNGFLSCCRRQALAFCSMAGPETVSIMLVTSAKETRCRQCYSSSSWML